MSRLGVTRGVWTLLLLCVLFKGELSDGATLQRDVNALYTIKGQFTQSVALANWNGNDPCGQGWTGVTCSGLPGTDSFVTVLNLQGLNIGGPLADQVSQLANLTTLNLAGNPITGTVPGSIGNLKQLQFLYLNATRIGGNLPSSIGDLPNLLEMRLDGCSFNGSVPYNIVNLRQIQRLYLNDNAFTGDVPYDLGSVSTLAGLFLQNNNFSGSIPNSFGKPINLQILALYNNSLSGSIPAELGNLQQLRGLYLQSNKLTGSIPDSLGNDGQLVELFLNDNQLTSTIPSSLGNLARLTSLVLSNNQLTGALPDSLGNLPAIKDLFVQGNNLTGPIPASFAKVPNFRYSPGNNFCSNQIGFLCSGGGCASGTGTNCSTVAPAPAASPSTLLQPTGLVPAAPIPSASNGCAVCPTGTIYRPVQGSCDCVSPMVVNFRLPDKQMQDWTTALSQSFESDLAGQLNLTAQQVNITEIRSGSVLLTVFLLPLTGPALDSPTVTRITDALYGRSSNPILLDPSKYGSVQVTDVTAPQTNSLLSPFSGSSSSSSGWWSTGKIVGIAVAGAAGVILLALIVAFVLCARRDKLQGATAKPRKTSSRTSSANKPPSPLPVVNGKAPELPVAVNLAPAAFVDPTPVETFVPEPQRLPEPVPVVAPVVPLAAPPRAESAKKKKEAKAKESKAARSTSIKVPAKVFTGTIDSKTFTLRELQLATNSFSRGNLIGAGGLGRVYRAELGQNEYAVKRLDANVGQNEVDFLTEVAVLSKLQHPHVVALLGYCCEGPERILAYEYLNNSTLEEHLHGPEGSERRSLPITWNARMKIALGMARALEYLHETATPPIVHRSFKTANVLLDFELNPHVSDCGLAKLSPHGSDRQVSSQMLGTFGYSAPEFIMTGQHTTKTDVWSFGVVLLELLTGRKPIDNNKPKSEQSLVRWAVPKLQNMEQLTQIVDPELDGMYPVKAISKVADIVSECLQAEAEFRPSMSEVVQQLQPLVPFANFQSRSSSMRSPRATSPSMRMLSTPSPKYAIPRP